MFSRHTRGALSLFAGMFAVLALAATLSGCAPAYGYPDYPAYGYAPYNSWGWRNSWGYDPAFVVHHPWEDHYGVGHHTEFYHGDGGHGGGEPHGVGGGFHGGGGVSHGGGGGGHR